MNTKYFNILAGLILGDAFKEEFVEFHRQRLEDMRSVLHTSEES